MNRIKFARMLAEFKLSLPLIADGIDPIYYRRDIARAVYLTQQAMDRRAFKGEL